MWTVTYLGDDNSVFASTGQTREEAQSHVDARIREHGRARRYLRTVTLHDRTIDQKWIET